MEDRQADLILKNGTIYLADHQEKLVSTLVIGGNRILYEGNLSQPELLSNDNTDIIDLKGRTAIPGFYDAHVHGIMGGLLMNQCLLTKGKSIREYIRIIEEYCHQHQKDDYIFGFGWIHSLFTKIGPEKQILDRVIEDKPAIFYSIDYHSLWVNSYALDMAGIRADTENPQGGHIEKYPDSYEPSGCLRESSAMDLIFSKLPSPTPEEWKKSILTYLNLAAKHGITGMFDAGILNFPQSPAISAVAKLDDESNLTVRIRSSYVFKPGDIDRQLRQAIGLRENIKGGDNFNLGVAKVFMDGAIEGHTGFLLEDYIDRKGFKARAIWKRELFEDLVDKLIKNIFQIHVHAIGDGASHYTLDIFETSSYADELSQSRNTLAHLELIKADDISRFYPNGLIASFQPAWFYLDENYYSETIPLLAKPRADRRYLLNDFIKAKVNIAFGSDWPWGTVSSTMNPFNSIGTAVTRKGPGIKEKSYQSRQRISLNQAINFHTRGGAWQNFDEKFSGTLEVGKLANIAILDRNIFNTDPELLYQCQVAMTIFNGKIIYRNE